MGHEGSSGDQTCELGMTSSDALYDEIKRMMDGGDPKEAIGAIRTFLMMHPDHALAHNDLGVCYVNSGEKEKALEHYERAAVLAPNNVTFQKNLADLYCFENGRLEDALKIYLKILENNPTDIEMLTTLGDICTFLEKEEDARIFYERVLELEPWNMDVHEKLEGTEEGEMPEDSWQMTEDGVLKTEVSGQRSEVSGHESEENAYESAQALIADGRHKEGIEALERLIERYPDYALAHNDLGVMYFNKGEKQKALEHYERAIALEPDSITFQKNLADFYCLEAGRLEDGLKIYLKLLEDNPADLETLMTLGDICVALEKNEDAKVFYERILELEPWNMDVMKKLDCLPV